MNPTVERRECPPEFQERLTARFGLNRFGTPHFRFVWGQTELMRMGSSWFDRDGSERFGYREVMVSGQPCWLILKWKDPIEYGSPDAFYAVTYDGYSKLYMMGEYPYEGRYEIVQPLISKELIDGQLVIEHFELSHYLIDTILPMILAFEQLSRAQQEAARQAVAEAEHRQEVEAIADRLMHNLPTYYGPVSFSGQGIRTSLLDRKMHEIQKVWDRMSCQGRRPDFARGVSAGERPKPVRYH